MRMTFTFSDKLASTFQALVPAGDRSSLIASFLEEELEKRRKNLIQVCQEASQNQEVEKVIDEWQSFDEKADGGW